MGAEIGTSVQQGIVEHNSNDGMGGVVTEWMGRGIAFIQARKGISPFQNRLMAVISLMTVSILLVPAAFKFTLGVIGRIENKVNTYLSKYSQDTQERIQFTIACTILCGSFLGGVFVLSEIAQLPLGKLTQTITAVAGAIIGIYIFQIR